ncbi:MAG TPA: histone deacetylase family protein [Paracoccaceae bacterium]|nr:histone deacetylase family protein [Paracoccaceae bacterium]
MRGFFAEEQKRHAPRRFMVAGAFRDSTEQPERADRLLAGARAAGLAIERPAEHGFAPIAAIHPPAYLRFLETIHARWRDEIEGAADEVLPNIHLDRTLGGYPSSPVGLAAFHQADTACPIGPHSWESARWSAWTAVSAAEAVLAGEGAAYALCRPPGHHAYADLAGGFCFLNNSAIAAQVLRRAHDRVAVLDVDVHHGNGTQGIFYARDDVLTVSLHADPAGYYPFLCGYAHERGAGRGIGYNLNLPLPRTTGDEDYMPALDRAVAHLGAFAPGALVLALGLDAHEDDPLKGMRLSTRAFERIGAAVARVGLPTVLVQEGGYLSDALGRNLTAFLTGFQGAG